MVRFWVTISYLKGQQNRPHGPSQDEKNTAIAVLAFLISKLLVELLLN
ncbi:hypothetical protein [Neobacillus vireti]